MAWNTIEYACGHKTQEQLYGPHKQRDAVIERAKERLCPACYKAKMDAARADESAKAAEAAKDAGLPSLTGSEKQIAWAESIRAKQVKELKLLDDALANAPAAAKPEAVRIGREIIANMIARTSAKDWIDGRNETIDRTWLTQKVKAVMG